MPIFKFGTIIRSRREELGYTQEELADGICSVPTLSRIENGERMPSKEHFEMLLQRLGYSGSQADAYVDEKGFRKHELKFRLRQAIILNRIEEAAALFEQFRESIVNPTPIDRQFLILYGVLTHPADYPKEKRLAPFEEALGLTCPGYGENRFPRVLSYEEIILINNIAISLFHAGQQEKAVELLYSLKTYHENGIVNPEEALRTQPLILYNLSKYLGLMGRYDESVSVSGQGVQLCRETGRCTVLARLLLNYAWALDKRGDKEKAREPAKQAWQMAVIMGEERSARLYKAFCEECFGESL